MATSYRVTRWVSQHAYKDIIPAISNNTIRLVIPNAGIIENTAQERIYEAINNLRIHEGITIVRIRSKYGLELEIW